MTAMKCRLITLVMLICSVPLTVHSFPGNLADPINEAVDDLTIVDVSVPDTGCLGTEAIVAVVENAGDNPASDFTVTYRINNTIPIMTMVSQTLNADDTMHVSFSNKFDFTAEGTYLLEVWVTYNNDEVPANDTLARDIVSLEKPVLAFDASLTCEQSSSLFTDESTHSQGIASRQWFVDTAANIVDTGSEASIHFPVQTQTIGLIAMANNGCADTLAQEVSAYANPIAAFNVDDGCEGEAIEFDNQSQISSGSIDFYEWHFGDGDMASGATTPDHTYQGSGFYHVTLLAVSNQGCADTTEAQIEIYDKPDAAFDHDAPICPGDTVIFTDQSSVPNGTITDRNWDFGDGSTASEPVATHIFEVDSSEVALIVTSDKGCRDTVKETVTASPVPVAAFTGDLEGCEMDTFLFINESTIGAGSIASFEWNFGDGNTSTAENPGHIYQSPGTFEVSLTAVSEMGCKDDTVVDISVLENPPQPVIERTGDTLYTTAKGDYQWFLHDSMITGATDSFYIAEEPGTYTVVVSNVECSSVSEPFLVVGIQRAHHSPIYAHIYPNPAKHSARIEISAATGISGKMQLWGMDGRMVEEIGILNNVKEWQGRISLTGKAAGTYFLVFRAANGGKLKVWPLQCVK